MSLSNKCTFYLCFLRITGIFISGVDTLYKLTFYLLTYLLHYTLVDEFFTNQKNRACNYKVRRPTFWKIASRDSKKIC